jgi:regulator of replication initiation timing
VPDGIIAHLRRECGGKLREDLISVERQAKDGLRQSQEREAQVIADLRNAVGRLGARLQAVINENSRQVLAASEMRRANEQLAAEVGGLKQRIEVLGQENWRLTKANEVVKQHTGAAVAEGSAKVKKDLRDLKRELEKWKEELRALRSKAEPLAAPSADVTVPAIPRGGH